jgi:hypothetical protein
LLPEFWHVLSSGQRFSRETNMKVLFAASALLVAAIDMQGAVFAQGQTRVYPYCLLDRSGGGAGAGGEAMRCAYDTMGQCMASKTGNTDSCIVNPYLTFPKRK